MRRVVGALALLCALSVLILAIPVGATAYEPTYYNYGLYASGETYTGTVDGVEIDGANGRSSTGTFTIPLNLSDSFKWLYIGARFPSITYDVGAQYKFVISFTTGTTGDYDMASVPGLYSASLKSGIKPMIDISTRESVSQNGVVSTELADTYTITYDGIAYDSVVGNNFYCIQLVLSRFTSLSETELYIVNSYFGLESYYDEDKYNSQIIENLNNINESLTGIQGSLDGIQNSLDSQIDNEIDRAEQESNNANAEAEEALGLLPDLSESYNEVLNNLTIALYDERVATSIPLPNGNVALPGNIQLDIFAGATEVDLSEPLNNEDIKEIITITKGLSVLACMACSVYWAIQLKEWITALDSVKMPEIPFLPGGGKY